MQNDHLGQDRLGTNVRKALKKKGDHFHVSRFSLADRLNVAVGRQLLRGFIGKGGVQGQPGRYWDLDAMRSAADYKIDSGEVRETQSFAMPFLY